MVKLEWPKTKISEAHLSTLLMLHLVGAAHTVERNKQTTKMFAIIVNRSWRSTNNRSRMLEVHNRSERERDVVCWWCWRIRLEATNDSQVGLKQTGLYIRWKNLELSLSLANLFPFKIVFKISSYLLFSSLYSSSLFLSIHFDDLIIFAWTANKILSQNLSEMQIIGACGDILNLLETRLGCFPLLEEPSIGNFFPLQKSSTVPIKIR